MRARIHRWDQEQAAGEQALFGIFAGDRIAGGCGLHARIAPDGLEIGYWIHPAFLRRGLATRAAHVLTCAALALPHITHVEIHHDKANVASAGVPRKLGFEFLRESPDVPAAPADVGIEWRWRMDRERWEAGPPRP